MAGGAFLRDRSLFRPTRQDHELGLQATQLEDTPDGKAFAFQMIQPHFKFGKAVGLIDDPGTGVVNLARMEAALGSSALLNWGKCLCSRMLRANRRR